MFAVLPGYYNYDFYLFYDDKTNFLFQSQLVSVTFFRLFDSDKKCRYTVNLTQKLLKSVINVSMYEHFCAKIII